ncbi:MAG: MerR family transcriptional regulator [bacterium]|nr:MerR family transcriptional regulator [bacterium]
MTAPARMRMRDLERVTGVGRETIRFYIREGLLPEPERTGRNSAWYDARFVERLRLVRELRQKRFLPLHVIKAIVGGDAAPSRDEVRTLVELDGKLFPAVAGMPVTPAERIGAVAKRTKLPVAEIRVLAESGALEIVTRGGGEWLLDPAIHMVELWARVRAAGFSDALGFGPHRLRLYVDLVSWLAREELRMFSQGLTGRVSTEEAVRMAEDGITLVNPIIGLLRRQILLRYIAQGNVPPPAPEPAPQAAGRVSRRRRMR